MSAQEHAARDNAAQAGKRRQQTVSILCGLTWTRRPEGSTLPKRQIETKYMKSGRDKTEGDSQQ
jgi:hypothetical protein